MGKLRIACASALKGVALTFVCSLTLISTGCGTGTAGTNEKSEASNAAEQGPGEGPHGGFLYGSDHEILSTYGVTTLERAMRITDDAEGIEVLREDIWGLDAEGDTRVWGRADWDISGLEAAREKGNTTVSVLEALRVAEFRERGESGEVLSLQDQLAFFEAVGQTDTESSTAETESVAPAAAAMAVSNFESALPTTRFGNRVLPKGFLNKGCAGEMKIAAASLMALEPCARQADSACGDAPGGKVTTGKQTVVGFFGCLVLNREDTACLAPEGGRYAANALSAALCCSGYKPGTCDISVSVNGKRHCSRSCDEAVMSGGNRIPLRAGSYRVSAVSGAFNYFEGYDCYWSYDVRARVGDATEANGVIRVPKSNDCGSSRDFYMTEDSAEAASKGKSFTLVVPGATGEETDVRFYTCDSACVDNAGTMQLKVERTF